MSYLHVTVVSNCRVRDSSSCCEKIVELVNGRVSVDLAGAVHEAAPLWPSSGFVPPWFSVVTCISLTHCRRR